MHLNSLDQTRNVAPWSGMTADGETMGNVPIGDQAPLSGPPAELEEGVVALTAARLRDVAPVHRVLVLAAAARVLTELWQADQRNLMVLDDPIMRRAHATRRVWVTLLERGGDKLGQRSTRSGYEAIRASLAFDETTPVDHPALMTDTLLVNNTLDRLEQLGLIDQVRFLELRFFSQLTQIEIAKILGLSKSQVNRLQAKALAACREVMES